MKIRLFALLAFSFLLFGCISVLAGEKAAEKLIPESSDNIVIVKISRLINDAELSNAYYAMSGRRISDEAETWAGFGLDIERMDSIYFFQLPDRSSGMIVDGGVNRDAVLAKAREIGVSETSYEGTTVYTSENASTASLSAFAFVGTKLIAGPVNVVKEAIDVSAGKKTAIAERDDFKLLVPQVEEGAFMISFRKIPEDVREQIRSTPPTGIFDSRAFAAVAAVAMSVGGKSGRFIFTNTFMTDSESDAQTLLGAIESGKSAVLSTLPANSTTYEAVSSAQVSSSGNVVKLVVSLSQDDLATLGESIGKIGIA